MAVLALLLGAGTPAAAGSLGANFGVAVTLNNPSGTASLPSAAALPAVGNSSGICFSDSLSQQTGALVRVVCANGQFVSISPRPGQRFFGTHGGAYGYYFGPSYGAIHRTAHGDGGGTVTSFRVYSVDEADGVLDLLVSF
jgi:hypothetical protein